VWAHFRGLKKHQQAAIIITVTAVIVAIVAGSFHLVAQGADNGIDSGGPRKWPPRALRLDLEKRFAPILKLDSKEVLLPISIPTYVSTTRLDERIHKVLAVLDPRPTAATLPRSDVDCFIAAGCMYQLDVLDAEPTHSTFKDYGLINNRLFANGAKMRVYAHVLQYTDSGDYSVQYWFLYLFNYRLNRHESDWEQITIQLDKDQHPLNVLYSSHSTGYVRTWDLIEHEGDHPTVYVARGSHANYFHAGSHPVTILCHFRICFENRGLRDQSNGLGRTLTLGRNYSVTEIPPPIYVGSYGTGNYVGKHRANDLLADPRTRPAWKNPLARLEKGKELPAGQ
jgi:hypothetical protein